MEAEAAIEGVRRPNILPYIILGSFREILEYAWEISRNSHGENGPACGNPELRAFTV